MKKRFAYGIDLGTTNSALALMDGKLPRIVKVQQGRTLPSVVEYHADGTVTVGQEAYKKKGNANVVYSSKRDMGSDKVYHLTLEDGSKKDVTPIEVASEVLKCIKYNRDELYAEVEEAVITVPAYFTEKQRRATQEAAKIAGIEVLKIINEPTSASLAYGVKDMEKEFMQAIIVDVGGGTTDITLIDVSKFDRVPEKLESLIPTGLCFDIIVNGGNSLLGGDDYDRLILDVAKKDAGNKQPDKREAINRCFTYEKNVPSIERWKQTVGTSLGLVARDGEERLELVVNEDHLDAASELFWDRINKCIEETLVISYMDTKAGEMRPRGEYRFPDIVIPVGGSTKNPRLIKKIKEIYGNEDIDIKIPSPEFADESVALGAAIQAGMVLGNVNDIVVKEVNPLPIGIAVVNERQGKIVKGLFNAVIKKDVPIPARNSVNISTVVDNQTDIFLEVYQGTDKYVKGNHHIGTITIDNLPLKPKGEVNVDVYMSVDVSGVLHVTTDLDGKQISAEFNSVLGSSKLANEKKLTKKENMMMKYMSSVVNFATGTDLKETDKEAYELIMSWELGDDIPEFAIKNKKLIGEYNRNAIEQELEDRYKDNLYDENDANSVTTEFFGG